MSEPYLFEITDGYFGLALVDTNASGYTAAWQSPSGDTGDGLAASPISATLAAYESAASGWSCQITSGALKAKATTQTTTVRSTFCNPSYKRPVVEQSQFTLDLRFYQDVDVSTAVVESLSLWLFDNDAEEAYFYLGFNQDAPPTCVGRVRLASGDIGGDPQTPLEATLSLQCTQKPLIEKVA